MARLKEFYTKTVVPKLKQDLGLKNVMQIPKITKITVNMGVGEAVADRKVMDAAVADLTKITGQKPKLCMSKKSIASFKVRENLAIGTKVTLRGERMWEFFDRLVTIAIPRIRDFRGINPRSFDGRGNFSLGIKEQIIFPEIDYDSIDVVRGLDITITTSAKTDLEAFELLLGLGMPFAQEGRPGQAEREEKEKEAEEEQRKEEARQKAEVEQAALEQLKEENPEAYAKPEAEGEGEGAAEGGDEEKAGETAEESSDNG